MRARALCLLFPALALLLAGCTYGSLASQRYTYIVKYSVTSTEAVPTAVDVTYKDQCCADIAAPGVIPPWSIELPALSYDYSAPYYATLVASAAGLIANESVAVTITLKDYRTGFAEETLARQVVTDPGTGGTPLDVALNAPELPLTR